MKRATDIAIEFVAYGLVAPIAAWLVIGSVGSFVVWGNTFDDENAMLALRLFVLIGFGVACFRTFHLIKNDKI